MKITLCQTQSQLRIRSAFSLIEVIFGMAMAGLMFLALYSGLTGGFAIVRIVRENTRATQILLEKMETIRLYTWDQINSNGFIPPTFTAAYYPMGGTNCGTLYTGKVTIASSSLPTSYASDVKKVTVQLNWTTGQLPRTRSISTYVCQHGLQNYVVY